MLAWTHECRGELGHGLGMKRSRQKRESTYWLRFELRVVEGVDEWHQLCLGMSLEVEGERAEGF